MPIYHAQVRDTRYILDAVLGLDAHAGLPGFVQAAPDVTEAVLTESARFCEEQLFPLDQAGDREGCTRHADGMVTTLAGFKAAYNAFCAAGGRLFRRTDRARCRRAAPQDGKRHGIAGGGVLIRRFAWCLPLLGAPVAAEPPSDAIRAVQAAAAVEPLAAGAIRFTAIRPRGGGATIYEAGSGGGGTKRSIIDLSPGADGRWSVDARETKPLAAETLDYFIGRIDAAIREAPDDIPCDGPVYYAEHGPAGSGGGCGADTPNAAIARALGLADPMQP